MTTKTFGFEHMTMVQAPPPEFISYAAAAGASTVSLFLKPRRFKGAEHLPGLVNDSSLRAETRARLNDSGLSVALIEGLLVDQEFAKDYVRRGLDVACEMDAQRLNTLVFDPVPARSHEHMEYLCEESRKAGVDVMLEFTPLSEVKDLEAALIWSKRHGNRIMLDTLHLERSGATPEDVAAAARDNPGLFSYIQLCDGPRGAVDDIKSYYREAVRDRGAPGDGEIRLWEMVQGVGPDLTISAEVPSSRLERGDTTADAHFSRIGEAMRSFLARF